VRFLAAFDRHLARHHPRNRLLVALNVASANEVSIRYVASGNETFAD
jgi:hypothetical protein